MQNSDDQNQPANEQDIRRQYEQTAEELRQSEDKFRLLAETALDAIITIDENSIILYANQASEKIFGYKVDELIGSSLTILIPEQLRQPHLDAMREYLITGKKRLSSWKGLVIPGLHKDGREIKLEISYSEFKGGKHLFTGIVRDITERAWAEEALRRSEENFRAVFNYTPAAVFSYDRHGIILQANPACERVYGFKREQLVGRHISRTVGKPEDSAKTDEVIARVFSGEAVENNEWEDLGVDGKSVWVLNNTTPVLDSRGNVIMGISLNIDIAERKLEYEREKETEAHKKEFYRRTILAATEGKLVISEYDEIIQVAGPSIAEWKIEDAIDVGRIRSEVARLACAKGMDEDRLDEFILTVGEAVTNAYKHAAGGTASLHEVDGTLMLVVKNQGPGIEALALPELALQRGYTTAMSLGMGYKVMISLC